MVVERYMTAKVITVRPNTSLWEAWNLTQTHQIGYLPVMQGRRLVGMISDRSLRQLMPSSLAPPDEQERVRAWGAQVKVEDVMSRKVFAVTPQTSTHEALRLILDRRVGCTPVLRGSILVGILTTRDLLQTLEDELRANALVPGRRPVGRRHRLPGREASREKARPAPMKRPLTTAIPPPICVDDT